LFPRGNGPSLESSGLTGLWGASSVGLEETTTELQATGLERDQGVDTIVIISNASANGYDLLAALRHRQIRAIQRPWSESRREIERIKPDSIVLDPPNGEHLASIIRPIRQIAGLENIPLFVVVEADRVEEAADLEEADDFFMRPLRPIEIIARIRSKHRLSEVGEDELITVGPLTVDREGYEARVDGKRIDLTYQEFELLKFLVSHPGKTFTREQLLTRVWGYLDYGGSRTVDIHVRRIRAKLGHPSAGWLNTVRHVGYKWALEV